MNQYRYSKPLDFLVHLGWNYQVTVKVDNPWNIRCWFVPEGQKELTLTKSGIALREKLKTAMILVEEILHGELDKVSFCEKTYQNQEGALICSNCNQNDFMNH